MAITAYLHNLRIAPRKVRIVARALRGLDVLTAKAKLRHVTKRASRPLEKLLDSALANAQYRRGVAKEHMFIKDIVVDEGVKLKRFKPRGFGITMPIQKKTSHITMVLDELGEDRRKHIEARLQTAAAKKQAAYIVALAKEKEREAAEKRKDEKSEKQEEKERFEKSKFSKELTKGRKRDIFSGAKAFGRRMFRRKKV